MPNRGVLHMNDLGTTDIPEQQALIVVSPEGENRGTIALAQRSIRVGRDADNDVALDPDPEQVTSREHCVIERIGRRWWVRDLGSRNHTYLERRGIRARVDHVELLNGDAICIQSDSSDIEPTGSLTCWRLAFNDPRETLAAAQTRWLQYFPGSETVWVLGGLRLPQCLEAKGKARRMLLFLLARYRELDEPQDGVFAAHAELKTVLWPDENPESHTDGAVANVAWELRTALDDRDHRLLQTETGAGYRLVPRP